MTPKKYVITFILLSFAMWLNARDSRYTRHGSGPLYWMAYEECYVTNQPLSEDRYRKSVDWVAENFRQYGYDMVCTDGWIEDAQTVNENGYITKYNSSWTHDFSYWIEYNRKKGLKTGVYYNPMWLTKAAYKANCPIPGSDKHVQDIDGGKGFKGRTHIYFVDVNKKGAKEWIQGYVKYFINLGVSFLRIDFLNDYEDYYGTGSYKKALQWIMEAAGDDITISLVMPNCNSHAANEVKYGDMFRISDDVFAGGWDFLSERQRGKHLDRWPQYRNLFDGFVKFSDVAGRGKIIMDGDFIRLNTCANDDERRFWISLIALTGSPIAMADQYDTMGKNGCFYTNEEILALNKAGFCAKPLSTDLYDMNSQKWVGQLPDGDWIVGLFNRNDTKTKISISLKDDLGMADGMAENIRDLWSHTDLGACTDLYSVDVPAHGCQVVRITPSGRKRYQAETATVLGDARIIR